jgi:hypothetical protein
MVFVRSPDETPTPLDILAKKSTTYKRFPDVLTHGTDSGIISQVSEGSRRTDLFLNAVPNSSVSKAELETRKILIGILIGLLVLCLAAFGFLMLFRKPPSPPLLIQKPIIQVPLVPEPIEPAEVIDIPPFAEALPELPPQDPPIEPEPASIGHPLTANDTLSVLDEKMPGFVSLALPNIDIEAKLAVPIHELNLSRNSLIGFVRFISQLTGVPITLNIDEMKSRSLSVKTPVDGQFSEAAAEKILTETLVTLGLQWISVDRQILIFPKKTTNDADLMFDVSDFARQTEDLTPQVLAEMIQKLVCPDENVAVLPDNRLTVVKNEPTGKSPQRLRDEILRFLEQLRVIRQLPQQTELTGETLAPEAFGWDQVVEPITLNYYQAVPLSRIVTQLESLTKLTIIIDHQSLHRSLCSFASIQTSVQCDHGTVNDAMELLLVSVDSAALVYRIIDHQTLEITTAESVRQPEKMIMEIHPYRLREDETWEDIVRLLHSAIVPGSWMIAELPETKYGGNIVADQPSQCLLIRQSQPAQRQIRLYLSESKPLAP